MSCQGSKVTSMLSEDQLDAAKVSDSIYDQANAKQLSKKPRKDERILTQQRMVWISSHSFEYLKIIQVQKKAEDERDRSVQRDAIAIQKEVQKEATHKLKVKMPPWRHKWRP